MDVGQLELLLEVVRHGSFASAARSRRVTPSTVSRAISSLEDALALRLFHRTTRHLTLTEAGERYVDRIRPVLTGLADASRFARDAEEVLTGEVRATVPTSFALRCVAPLLPMLRRTHPGLTLDLVLTDRRLDLIDDRLDFAIRLGRLSDPNVVVRRVFRMRYRVVASPAWVERRGWPQRPSDLAEVDALIYPLPAEGPVWRFRGPVGSEEVAVAGPLSVTSTLVLRQAAIDGVGVTVLPHWLVDDAVAAGELVVLLPEHEVTLTTFDASVWLALPTRRYVPARVRAVTEFLVQELQAYGS